MHGFSHQGFQHAFDRFSAAYNQAGTNISTKKIEVLCLSRRASSGVQWSDDARGDCLIGCPLPKPNIEPWRMMVIVTGYTLFVTSQYDVIFRFATNSLAKFVDTTCAFRDAGAAVGQRGAVKQLRAIGTYKKQKYR